MKLRRCLAVLPVMLFCFTALAQTDIPVDLTTAFSTADVTARHIVRLVASSSGDGYARTGPGAPYLVPAGKRLVVNNATFSIAGPTGIGFQPFVYLEANSGSITDFQVILEPHKVQSSIGGFDSWVATMTAPLYVDANQPIRLFLSSHPSAGISVAGGRLQGYLVDCGAAGCTEFPTQ